MREYKHEDITGQVFGYLTALEHMGRSKWKCRCVCGKEKIVNKADLKRGCTKSCGCKISEIRDQNGYKYHKPEDLTGRRFGNLVAIEMLPRNYNDPILWRCKCDCGNERIVRHEGLKYTGISKCVNCQRDSIQKRYPRLVRIYADMKQRCLNPKNNGYERYGGRGISVCEEWKNSFESFAAWALDNGYSDDLSIDRIDVDGNYEPSNCRWATVFEQANNTSQNVYITYKGETHSRSEWSRILGISKSGLQYRLNKGWSIEEAFETPVSKHNGKYKRVAVET